MQGSISGRQRCLVDGEYFTKLGKSQTDSVNRLIFKYRFSEMKSVWLEKAHNCYGGISPNHSICEPIRSIQIISLDRKHRIRLSNWKCRQGQRREACHFAVLRKYQLAAG